MKSLCPLAIVAAALTAMPTSALADATHPYGWRLGTDGNGTIKVDFLWEMTHKKFLYNNQFRGAYDTSLTFDEYDFPIPEIGFVPFDQDGAEIEIVFTHFDTGVFFRDPADPRTPINTPGARFALGTTGTTFSADSIWQVDPFVQGFDLTETVWNVSFYFTDTTGTYADTEAFTYQLQPILEFPTPGTALVLLPGLLCARRRRG